MKVLRALMKKCGEYKVPIWLKITYIVFLAMLVFQSIEPKTYVFLMANIVVEEWVQKIETVHRLSSNLALLPFWGRISIITVLAVLGLLMIASCVYVKRSGKHNEVIKTICHSSMGGTQFIFEKNDMFTVDQMPLSLDDEMANIGNEYHKIADVVKKQDDAIKHYLKNLKHTDKRGYAGVAHSPLLFRAGNTLGNRARYSLFHLVREKKVFTRLIDVDIPYALIPSTTNRIKKCNEMLVTISTSFQINESVLAVFRPKEKCVIHFSSSQLGFDVINSKKQIEQYTDIVRSVIMDVTKHQPIQKIHIVIASSAAFTVALGQVFQNTYMPEAIMYHYDAGSPEKYPWGISLRQPPEECIVTTHL